MRWTKAFPLDRLPRLAEVHSVVAQASRLWGVAARRRAQARRLRHLAVLGVLLACSGCYTAPKAPLFTASGPGWRVQEGQALWRPKRDFPELAGELVVARDDNGRCMIQFAKTPLPLVMAQTTREKWRIEFPPRRMRFGGAQPPPSRLAFTWLYVSAALSGQPLPKPFRFEQKADGGWRLENTRSGETLEGFLSP